MSHCRAEVGAKHDQVLLLYLGKFSKKGMKRDPAALYPWFARHVVERNCIICDPSQILLQALDVFTSPIVFPWLVMGVPPWEGRDSTWEAESTLACSSHLGGKLWHELQLMVVGSSVMRVDHSTDTAFPREGNPA